MTIDIRDNMRTQFDRVALLLTRKFSHMAQTYLQIQRQIETLQRQADKLKTQEVAGVVERIKVAIKHYGLTAEQLGFGSGRANSGSTKKLPATSAHKKAIAPKYADAQGNTWSGRGPRPHWLRDALASGETLESFASDAGQTAGRAPKSPAPKRTARHYSDGSGNEWSGFGPRPRWLKDALAAGADLAQFEANPAAQQTA